MAEKALALSQMSIYPPHILERLEAVRFAGRCPEADAEGHSAAFECGCFVRLELKMDDAAKRIEQARFESNGCGVMVAEADRACEWLSGKLLSELHGNAAGYGPIAEHGREHCSQAVAEAAAASLRKYREIRAAEFRGETALICSCFGIAEDVLEACIRRHRAATVDEVIDHCRAGGGCGSCQPLIAEMLDIADCDEI